MERIKRLNALGMNLIGASDELKNLPRKLLKTAVFDKKGIKNILKPYKEETEIDWSIVAVDTPVLVRDYEQDKWERGYFSEYTDGYVFAWTDGRTFWTSNGVARGWKYAKLAEEG